MSNLSWGERKRRYIDRYGEEAWKKYTREQRGSHQDRKARYIRNQGEEAWKEYQRKRAQVKRKNNKDAVNERQRDYYARKKEQLKPKIYASRSRRNPHRGLQTLIDSFRRGHIEYDELARRLNTAVIQSHALTDGRARKKISK